MHSVVAALLLACAADAHIAMWNKGLFGLNWPHQATDSTQDYNNNLPVVPLRKYENLPISRWFGHGLKAYPPAPGDFMELESGGTFVGELSCNRAWTSLRHPWNNAPLMHYACPDVGPLHVFNKFGEKPDPQYFGGTAIAIAYTSDVEALMPDDMIVISVNYTSVWTRETDYPIPCGLPPCPPGGCLCTWNWIHQAWHGEGYGEEIYNNLYRCNVTGEVNPENKLELKSGVPPVFCGDDPDKCVFGPKQPMYIWQAEGNNMPWPGAWPHYNHKFGYRDGAQLDIFSDQLKTQCPEKKAAAESGSSEVPIPVVDDEAHHVAEEVPEGHDAQAPMSAGAIVGVASSTKEPTSAEQSPRKGEQHALQVFLSAPEVLASSFREAQRAFSRTPLEWVSKVTW